VHWVEVLNPSAFVLMSEAQAINFLCFFSHFCICDLDDGFKNLKNRLKSSLY